MDNSRTTATILALPDELLYMIIEETRPFGFESILLACKQTYRIGKPLISDHNFRRKWSIRIHNLSASIQPVLIFRELLYSPLRHRNWLLSYIQQYTIVFYACPGVQTVAPAEFAQILHDVETHAPQIAVQLSRDLDRFPEVESKRIVWDPEASKRLHGADHPWYDQDDSEADWMDDDYERPETPPMVYAPNPRLYEIFTILLFPNIQRLQINGMIAIRGVDHAFSVEEDWQYNLFWFVKRSNGRTYFQHLELLKFEWFAYAHASDISACLMLPKLKALVADKPGATVKGPWTRLSDWPPHGSKSPLQYLVFLRSCIPTKVAGQLIGHVRALETFIWEDDLDMPRIVPATQNAQEAIEEPSFRPKQLIEHLELTQRSTLRHLVITIAQIREEHRISKDDLIFSITALDRLTQLEIDTDLLYPRGDLPPPLTDILPSSIQIVHLIIRQGNFAKLHQLLWELPHRRSSFLALSSIVIRFAECGSLHESIVKIQPLQELFRSVGIQLEMKELTKSEMYARLPIVMNEREQREDLRWLFQGGVFVKNLR